MEGAAEGAEDESAGEALGNEEAEVSDGAGVAVVEPDGAGAGVPEPASANAGTADKAPADTVPASAIARAAARTIGWNFGVFTGPPYPREPYLPSLARMAASSPDVTPWRIR